MTCSCSNFPDTRQCYPRHPGPRTQAEIRAAHRAAVARAKRSGFADQPLPLWLWQTYDPTAFTTGQRWAA